MEEAASGPLTLSESELDTFQTAATKRNNGSQRAHQPIAPPGNAWRLSLGLRQGLAFIGLWVVAFGGAFTMFGLQQRKSEDDCPGCLIESMLFF
jgi:hypothetical protein